MSFLRILSLGPLDWEHSPTSIRFIYAKKTDFSSFETPLQTLNRVAAATTLKLDTAALQLKLFPWILTIKILHCEIHHEIQFLIYMGEIDLNWPHFWKICQKLPLVLCWCFFKNQNIYKICSNLKFQQMNFRIIKDELYSNLKSLSANSTKWSNILKQFTGKLLKKGLKFSHPKRLHFLASSRSPNKIYKYKIYKLRFVEISQPFQEKQAKETTYLHDAHPALLQLFVVCLQVPASNRDYTSWKQLRKHVHGQQHRYQNSTLNPTG